MAESSSLSSGKNVDYLKAAFLAMEPPNCFISLARQIGGGSITAEVQTSILEHCINNVGNGLAYNNTYVRNILKKVIIDAESTSEVIVDGLYEKFAYHMGFHTENEMLKEKNKIYKQISFLFPSGYNDFSDLTDLVVPLQCSLNMLEGDTGCALWPSSLFLSEFILTHPDTFSNKHCFEVGSGVGLVGISLVHVGASKVILSDGDESSLANMKYNLELNQLHSETKMSQRTYIECKHLQWESLSKSELSSYVPDIVWLQPLVCSENGCQNTLKLFIYRLTLGTSQQCLGADIIYDPLCLPHLIEVLSILLSPIMNDRVFTHNGEHQNTNTLHSDVKEAPVAYIAQVIRNYETFRCFLKLADDAHLCVVDITESRRLHNLLPYMLSYDRSSARLFRVSSSRNNAS